MNKKPEDPSMEIFANLRTIMIFVVLGSTIVAYVEYQSQKDAEKTYERWDDAVKEKQEAGEYLSWTEFNKLIAGYPRQLESKTVVPPKVEEKESKTKKPFAKKEEKEPEKEEEEEESKAVGKKVDYIWSSLFTKSSITVTMSDEEDPVIYRVSPIQH